MAGIIKKLGFIDRFLTLWIFVAMGVGIGIGFLYPPAAELIGKFQVGTTSLPIAVGLILMMYPPLAKVKYEEMHKTLGNKKLLVLSMIQNWIFGPLLMFILAVLFLREHPGYMIGVILVGLARCIAMVIVWNDLAGGDRELGVGIVSLNAIFQILFYAFYIYLFITVFLNALDLVKNQGVHISIWESAKTVLIYLGIPFFAGLFSRIFLIRLRGNKWYDEKFIPRISPLTLIALLFTIVVMFSIKGKNFVESPLNVLLVALPYTIYFLIMWFSTYFVAGKLGASYEQSTAVSFSAASNDFELAIAAAISIFGLGSDQAFAAVIGPLIEVPVMVVLVNAALKLKKSRTDAL